MSDIQNANLRKDLQKFAACQCGSTLLHEQKLTRAVIEPAGGRLKRHHELAVFVCSKCNNPVLSKMPTLQIELSMLRELVDTDVSLHSLLCKEIEIDLNTINEAKKRFVQRRGSLASKPITAPEKSQDE